MELKELSGYGDLMSFKEFGECIKCGLFIPDDGIGYYATATQESNTPFKWNKNHPEGATHIKWYNK